MMRRKARELALQVLFQMDLTGCGLEKAWSDGLGREEPQEPVRAYAERLTRGVGERLAELDGEISRRAKDWSLERMATVDRTILRMGMWELLHAPDVPHNVVANEAVELAKGYSTAESGRFVNGILGALIRERGGTPPTPPADEEPPAPPADDAPVGAGQGV